MECNDAIFYTYHIQGGVVGNAGMTWPSNLQRNLDMPLLNFGFSGSCGMQPSVATALTQVAPTPRVFIMDCLPNMQQDTPDTVYNATLRIVTQLREALGPAVPIVVLEGHDYTSNWIKANQATVQKNLNDAQRRAVVALTTQGSKHLHYVSSQGKLGGDVGVAQDSTGGIGVHPTSLAHLHMSNFVAEKVNGILEL